MRFGEGCGGGELGRGEDAAELCWELPLSEAALRRGSHDENVSLDCLSLEGVGIMDEACWMRGWVLLSVDSTTLSAS